MKLTLHAFLSLDGVVQGPGGPDEDRDGGFVHGGWTAPYGDKDFRDAVLGWIVNADAFVFGRHSYQLLGRFWPTVTDPHDAVAAQLNQKPKYVASTTTTALDWTPAELLGPDVVAGVQRLKLQPGNELQVHGSGELAQTLIDHDLIDEYRLLVFPVHLGAGRRLFRDSTRAAALRPTSSTLTQAGVVITTYVPAGRVRHGAFELEDGAVTAVEE